VIGAKFSALAARFLNLSLITYHAFLKEHDGRTTIPHPSNRPVPSARRALDRAEPRRSRRGGHQDRAPEDRRRFARVRPALAEGRAGKDTTESAYFASANRGKKSVTVNLSKPEGQDIVRRSAAQCDVLLENYKVGDLARYGLGYEDLKKINPRSSTAR
jgi:hypothetical protein